MSNKNPCQNKPIECAECKTLVWSYKMKEHYRISNQKIQACFHEIGQDKIA